MKTTIILGALLYSTVFLDKRIPLKSRLHLKAWIKRGKTALTEEPTPF